jgi:hypothetical protein
MGQLAFTDDYLTCVWFCAHDKAADKACTRLLRVADKAVKRSVVACVSDEVSADTWSMRVSTVWQMLMDESRTNSWKSPARVGWLGGAADEACYQLWASVRGAPNNIIRDLMYGCRSNHTAGIKSFVRERVQDRDVVAIRMQATNKTIDAVRGHVWDQEDG